MDLTLTDDQELIVSTAREFLEARCPVSHVREMAGDHAGYSSQLWEEMAALGWMGMAFPEEHGGFGAGFLELCLIVEEMGRVLLPSPFVPTVVLAGMALASHGTEEQLEARLAAIVSGETVLSYARAEPAAGWPTSGSSVVASSDGSGFSLSGSAMFVPYAHVADELVVVAQRQGDADHLTAFLVPTGELSTEPLDTVAGHEHRVMFEDVSVGPDQVLGDVGRGGEVVATVTAYGAAARCAEMAGGARRVLDMTVEYAGERTQFDSPIGSFQAIQHHCANMGVDVLSSRLQAYEAIWRLSEGLDATAEVSMAKAWVSEAYRRVCSLGHQVHGAIGFTREHDLHHYLRHAMSGELAFGDGDHHWGLIADGLGLPA